MATRYLERLERDRKWLEEKHGIPGGDSYDLPTSEKRFPDGGQYRLEIPGIQNPIVMSETIKALEEEELKIHRITETRGIMRLTDKQIKQMVETAKQNRIELVLSVGPRAPYDTGASVQTAEGMRISYRLRGSDQLVRAMEDVKRATDLGVRGILVYDEGLLWVLNEMRIDKLIPPDTIFKVSAHCGHGNPASAKLLEKLGANSINPVRDLQLPMIAAIRKAIKVPLDIHTDNPKSSGGFIRTYEAPGFVKVASPIYLKGGPSAWGTHAYIPTTNEIKMAVAQVSLVQQMLERYYPDAISSPFGSKDLAIPK